MTGLYGRAPMALLILLWDAEVRAEMEELVLDGRERPDEALVKPAGESRPQERVEFVHIAVSLDP